MSLLHVQALNFRNLHDIQFDVGENFNIMYGANGSGKTSILEAIYYLGLGRSFRTHLLKRIIQYNMDKFALFDKYQINSSTIITVGIERHLDGEGQIRIAGEGGYSKADLAKIMPLQLLNQNSYRLFEEGSKPRRQLIDWGVFHVEHLFFQVWKKADRIIEQRNAALKSRIDKTQIQIWDTELSTLSAQLTQMRSQYIAAFIPVIQTMLQKLLENINITIDFYQGWDNRLDLYTVLNDSLERDLRLGYTSHGPHRADLLFKINGVPANDVLSRGQQKVLLFACMLAQGSLLHELARKKCIYLIDDLAAELDVKRQQLLAGILTDLQAQVFITSLENATLPKLFANQNTKLFHVEHGAVAVG